MVDARENHHGLATDSDRVPGRHRERVRRADPPGVLCADGGEGGFAQRDRAELFDFPWRTRCGTGDRGHHNCVAGRASREEQRGLVLSDERPKFPCGNRSPGGDEHPEDGTETTRGFPFSEFHPGLPLRDARSANPLRAASTECLELVRLAVRSFPATICEGHFAQRGAWVWIADELCGGWRRPWGAALCRADRLQRTGTMDRDYVHDLRDWPGGCRGIASFLDIVGGAADWRDCR